jgi:3-phenylpropionate/trans-cinnamate dioxygenase ferredoxin reductase subunit
MSDRVVIVGAGHAGGACAIALRDNGFSGSIVMVGEEAHPPYERPSLSKSFLEAPSTPDFLATADRWAELAVELRLGVEVVAVDREARTVTLSDGLSLPYDRLVVATGGHARRLPFPSRPGVHYLRNVEDALGVADAAAAGGCAVVIGGGVIGLEVASTLRGRGMEVTVVEAGDRLLGRNVPREAAGWLADAHQRVGVDIRLGRSVASLSGESPLTLTLDDGSILTADFVVAGIGIVPAVGFLVAAGLAEAGGVPVDSQYRSLVDPAVYAIGDVALRTNASAVAGRMETWAHAQSSARAAALSIAGLPPEAEPAPWFWTDQCGQTLQIVGRPELADTVVPRGDNVRLYMSGDALVGAACLDQPRDFGALRRLIGTSLSVERARDPAIDLRRAAL